MILSGVTGGATGGVTAITHSVSGLVTGDTKTSLFSHLFHFLGVGIGCGLLPSFPTPLLTSRKGTDLNLDVYLKANFDTTPPLVNRLLIYSGMVVSKVKLRGLC